MAIANRRLIACDERGVTFQWKDYRAQQRDRHKTMTLTTDEFIRRFLIHVLPRGFHRIRHYGLFANKGRASHLARAHELLQISPDSTDHSADHGTRPIAFTGANPVARRCSSSKLSTPLTLLERRP